MTEAETWTVTHDRTPYENLRALMHHLDIETPTAEICRLAAIRIPGLGDGDEHIVEAIRETFAEEHALARAQQWLNGREKPPRITIPAEQTTQEDDGNGVSPETVHAAIEHRLRTRSPRACLDHDSERVIECTGPDDSGYQCSTCSQQYRREDAILDALLDLWEEARDAPQTPQQTIADGGEC